MSGRTAPPEILYRLGEPAARLFLLRKGRVKLTRATAPGRELVMAVLVAGDVCGLGALLDISEHYFATALNRSSRRKC